MGQIVQANSFNPAAVNADDLYIVIVNPPSYIRGIATDVIGIVGTASWGPVNAAVHGGSAQDLANTFGPISTASLTDPYDMATDAAVAFGQQNGGGSSIEGYGVRVTDGTDVAASAALTGVTTAAAQIATVGGTITTGDTVALTATSTALTGSPVVVTYTVKSSDTLTSVAAGLVALLNATPALIAAGVNASNVAGVITIYAPSTLSQAITWSKTATGTETITLSTGSASTAGGTATAIYTGSLGNQVSIRFITGAQTGGITASVSPPSGLAEVYPNLPATNFWAAFALALAFGISGVRAPSGLIRLTSVNGAVGTPTAGTLITLTGGTDGRAGVTTANLVGNDTITPKTGMYALRSQNPAVGIVWLVGVTDSTAWPSLLAFGNTEGASTLAAFPIGTSTATATAAVASNGLHDPSFTYTKDWVYFFDSINNLTRPISPNAFIGGTWAGLGPQFSPSNTPVNLVLGTDRSPPNQVGAPYTDSEIGQLATAGIMFITNPIPAGSQWGIREGQSTSLNAVTQPVEYWRMTSYLARSFNSSMGKFIGQLQSQQPNDPLRQAVRLSLNNFLTTLVGLNQIDDFVVICGFSASTSAAPGLGINTPTSVSQHYLYAMVQVRYLSSVRFFILSLQGGTTVVTVVGTQPAS